MTLPNSCISHLISRAASQSGAIKNGQDFYQAPLKFHSSLVELSKVDQSKWISEGFRYDSNIKLLTSGKARVILKVAFGSCAVLP